MKSYSDSELVLNSDGSIFHLRLLPGQISDTVLLVGDPGRVCLIGQFLTRVENLASNREFVSLSGYYHNEKITVLSTGIGPDNIDIVVNELDALANINLDLRTDHPVRRSLRLVRIGTSGSIQPDLEVGSSVASAWSVGLDGLMHFYYRAPDPERELFERTFRETVDWPAELPMPYGARASEELLGRVGDFTVPGITIAAHGFYGPQGRQLRAGVAVDDLNERMRKFTFGGLRTSNFEMESSALYGLSKELGHEALTVCMILANRISGTFLCDYTNAINIMVLNILNSITK